FGRRLLGPWIGPDARRARTRCRGSRHPRIPCHDQWVEFESRPKRCESGSCHGVSFRLRLLTDFRIVDGLQLAKALLKLSALSWSIKTCRSNEPYRSKSLPGPFLIESLLFVDSSVLLSSRPF